MALALAPNATAEAPEGWPRYKRLILAELAGPETDVAKIADAVWGKLDVDDTDELVRDALKRFVLDVMGLQRRALGRSDGRPSRSPKWARIAVMQIRIGSSHERLGGMTPADVDAAADEYHVRAEANAAWEASLRAIAKLARDSKAETVGALNEDAVRALLPGHSPPEG